MKVVPSLETLREWMEQRNQKQLVELAEELNPVDLAALIEELEPQEIINYLSLLDISLRALVFSYFSDAKQLEVFQSWPNRDFAPVFRAMRSNERVDFFQKLSSEDQRALLPYLDAKTRTDLIHLSSYPPQSAGGIMSSDFLSFPEDAPIAKVLEKIKIETPRKKILYYIYVVDEDQYLKGVISFRDLLIHPGHVTLGEIMTTPVVSAEVDEDREIVARRMEEYDLIALPVTNKHGQILGIVEHDVAIETLRAEETEDLQKFMGITQEAGEKNYLETSTWEHFRKRVSWITILSVLGVISGFIIHRFERTLEALMVLAFYMPMVADTGGNCGSQSATLVVRALALKEIELKDWWRIIWKEFKVSFLVAGILALVAFAKVMILSSGVELPQGISLTRVAFVITVALCLQVITSTVIGALLPLIVQALRGDPAVAASPLITTVVDMTGLLLYFGTASLILGIGL